jgi:hypothetical protein
MHCGWQPRTIDDLTIDEILWWSDLALEQEATWPT